jgi:hypothetical protein
MLPSHDSTFNSFATPAVCLVLEKGDSQIALDHVDGFLREIRHLRIQKHLAVAVEVDKSGGRLKGRHKLYISEIAANIHRLNGRQDVAHGRKLLNRFKLLD